MVRVLLKSPDPRLGDSNELDVEEDMTIGEVRLVVSTLPCLESLHIPPSSLRLIFRGRALMDDDETIGNVFRDVDLTQPVTLHAVIARIDNEPNQQQQQQQQGGGVGEGQADGQPHIEFKLSTFLAAVFAAAIFTSFFRSDNTLIVCICCALGYLFSIGVFSWVFRKLFPEVPRPPPQPVNVNGNGQQNPGQAPHPPRPLWKKIMIAVAVFFASFLPSFNPRDFVGQFD